MSKDNVSPCDFITEMLVKNWKISLKEAKKTTVHDFKIVCFDMINAGYDINKADEKLRNAMIEMVVIYSNCKLCLKKRKINDDEIIEAIPIDALTHRLDKSLRLRDVEVNFDEIDYDYFKTMVSTYHDYKDFGIDIDNKRIRTYINNNVISYMDTKYSFIYGIPSMFQITHLEASEG